MVGSVVGGSDVVGALVEVGGVVDVEVVEVVGSEVSTGAVGSEDVSATSCALAHEVSTRVDTAASDPSSFFTWLIMP